MSPGLSSRALIAASRISIEMIGSVFCSELSRTMPLLNTERFEAIAAPAGDTAQHKTKNDVSRIAGMNFLIALYLSSESVRLRFDGRGRDTAPRRGGCPRG